MHHSLAALSSQFSYIKLDLVTTEDIFHIHISLLKLKKRPNVVPLNFIIWGKKQKCQIVYISPNRPNGCQGLLFSATASCNYSGEQQRRHGLREALFLQKLWNKCYHSQALVLFQFIGGRRGSLKYVYLA